MDRNRNKHGKKNRVTLQDGDVGLGTGNIYHSAWLNLKQPFVVMFEQSYWIKSMWALIRNSEGFNCNIKSMYACIDRGWNWLSMFLCLCNNFNSLLIKCSSLFVIELSEISVAISGTVASQILLSSLLTSQWFAWHYNMVRLFAGNESMGRS